MVDIVTEIRGCHEHMQIKPTYINHMPGASQATARSLRHWGDRGHHVWWDRRWANHRDLATVNHPRLVGLSSLGIIVNYSIL